MGLLRLQKSTLERMKSRTIITEFEQAVREFKLRPDQFIRSVQLREWTSRNKNAKCISKYLLEA